MTVKRRVIWMRDDEWKELTAYAKDQGETVSGVIRLFWRHAAGVPNVLPLVRDPKLDRPRVTQTQAQRDAILRRINKP